jgi:leukotriene-A4 hydrolase
MSCMHLRPIIAAIAIALAGCKGAGDGTGPRRDRDPHSHAEPDRVAVRHLDLDLAVDFTSRRLTGVARLSLVRHDRGAPLVLDAAGLALSTVNDCAGRSLAHRYPVRDKLVIDVTTDCVEINYVTPPDASALLWVEPSGTAGGAQPMLFTQSQAIHARTWIPLQDSPGVRFTYEATIRPPDGMWALMSAENPQAPPADNIWRFRQSHPIPSYLMALAVGDFAFRSLGPRTGVYAEPSVVDAAAHEFAEVEAMMTAAEALYGPYRWGRYDMLVLPPSFPFGGMENPNLTFLTPTVISGDRALVSLIAHELAHSWSGNLATNSTWNDVWLNEGFTTYVEHRIMEKLRGAEATDVLWHIAGGAILDVMLQWGPLSPRTRLAHDYGADTDPDSIPTDVAYEKGALLLRTLEHAYGRERFDRFLRGWFDRHAFASVDTRMFVREARAELGDTVDLEGWVWGLGLPADAAPTTSARAAQLGGAARELATAGVVPDATGWSTLDWTLFLRALPKDIAQARLAALDARHQLTTTRNAEIAMFWLPRLVVADMREHATAVEAFLLEVGRRRMVMPVYEAMVATNDFWNQLARTTFERARPRYHPITRDTVARLVAR